VLMSLYKGINSASVFFLKGWGCLHAYDIGLGCLCPCIRGQKLLVSFFKGVGVLACL
jgi:hypothetical protein